MNIKYPEYNNCLVNLTNSILKYFTGTCYHNTLPLVDEYLNKNYDTVIILQLDALGKNVLEINSKRNGFFRKNVKDYITSVFPPTTVAATTSTQTALYPSEHGWLGWVMHFYEKDVDLPIFLNIDLGNKYLPYKDVTSIIKDNGIDAYIISPYGEKPYSTIDEMFERMIELSKDGMKKYIYSYYNEPDSTMHMTGVSSKETKDVIKELEQKVKDFSKELHNTLLIVTADHSQIDIKNVYLEDYPVLYDCLKRHISIEGRAVNFFIKDDKKEKFMVEFNKIFSNEFILMSKEEVISSNLFGFGEHPTFRKRLGDYLAVAVNNLCINEQKDSSSGFVGAHAGMVKEEMMIPLIIKEIK